MKKLYIALNYFYSPLVDKLKKRYEIKINPSDQYPPEEELCNIVKEFDAIIIGASCKMTAKINKALGDRDFVIGTTSVGVDHIDRSFFDNPNVKVCNCEKANYISVAEHTIMMALALLKDLLGSDKSTRAHRGRKGMRAPARDAYQKTIGVIGAGKIGRKVIEYSKVLGMNILCCTANPDRHADLASYVEFCDLDTLMKGSDVVSIHVPYNQDTNNMLNFDKLSLMKNDAVLINTSRLRIVDNKSLALLLREGKIFGAGIDIDGFETETIDMFQELDNVILTPHIAGVTKEASYRMCEEAAEGVFGYGND